MIGLLVILVVGGYLLVAILVTYFVVKLAGKRGALKRGKFIAGFFTLFVFWLIPFWDWIPTVVYHKHLCVTEAGTKIYRSVEGVEGFLADGAWPLDLGYQYADALEVGGGTVRYRKNPDKSSFQPWVTESAKEPSMYGYKYTQTPLKLNEVKSQHVIYVVSSGEILATLTDFSVASADPYVHLSEWRKLLWPLCRPCLENIDMQIKKEMVLKTLKPI